MSQSLYIEKILSKFGIDCKPQSTPCEMEIIIMDESNVEPADEKYY